MQTIDQLNDTQIYKLLCIFAKHVFSKITTVEKYADWSGDYYLYDKFDEEVGKINIEPNNIINVYINSDGIIFGARYKCENIPYLLFKFESMWCDRIQFIAPKCISGTDEEIKEFNSIEDD